MAESIPVGLLAALVELLDRYEYPVEDIGRLDEVLVELAGLIRHRREDRPDSEGMPPAPAAAMPGYVRVIEKKLDELRAAARAAEQVLPIGPARIEVARLLDQSGEIAETLAEVVHLVGVAR